MSLKQQEDSETRKGELREILRRNVPPYRSDKMTRDLCDDVLETFGSLYPGQALELCMRIAEKVANGRREAILGSSLRKKSERIKRLSEQTRKKLKERRNKRKRFSGS